MLTADELSVNSPRLKTLTLAFKPNSVAKVRLSSGAFGFLEDNKVRARSCKNGSVGRDLAAKQGAGDDGDLIPPAGQFRGLGHVFGRRCIEGDKVVAGLCCFHRHMLA